MTRRKKWLVVLGGYVKRQPFLRLLAEMVRRRFPRLGQRVFASYKHAVAPVSLISHVDATPAAKVTSLEAQFYAQALKQPNAAQRMPLELHAYRYWSGL